MKTIALIKTFRGDEFAEASLESVYPWVDKIIAVHSHVGWDGREGNTVLPIYKAWGAANDPAGKIVNVIGAWRNQAQQYDVGMQTLTGMGLNVPGNALMFFDTDEVWDAWELQQAIRIVKDDNGNHPAYTSSMRVHIKSWRYIVDPPFGAPTCFAPLPAVMIPRDPTPEEKEGSGFIIDEVGRKTATLFGCRGEPTPNKRPLLDTNRNCQWVHMHHFTLVRRSLAEVREKIAASFEGDGERKDKTPDVDRWMREVWDKIPDVEDFHPFPRVKHVWHGLKTIAWDDLPDYVKRHPELAEIEAL